ncbi:MAG: hypothetical protein AB1765_12635 [Candidatus Hydrogenedentota bacterium]
MKNLIVSIVVTMIIITVIIIYICKSNTSIKQWEFASKDINQIMAVENKSSEIIRKNEFSQDDIDFINQAIRQDKDIVLKGAIICKELIPKIKHSSTERIDKIIEKPRNNQAINILISFIQDESITDTIYKSEAIRALSLHRKKEHKDIFERILQTETELEIRAACGSALYRISYKERAYDIYEEVVKNGYPVSVGQYDFKNDPDAKEMLFRTLQYDNNPVGQALSLYFLSRLGENKSISDIYVRLYDKLKNNEIFNKEEKNAVEIYLEWTKYNLEGK